MSRLVEPGLFCWANHRDDASALVLRPASGQAIRVRLLELFADLGARVSPAPGSYAIEIELLKHSVLIRLLDLVLAAMGILLLSPVVFVLIALGAYYLGSPFFVQQRVGRGQKIFTLLKLRSLPIGTPSVPTHLVGNLKLTPFGNFLRRTKLDEIPQLWNVLTGDMSLVGPRPCLPNQQELIVAREKLGVFEVRPGITGLAQVNKIDMSTPQMLAETDKKLIATLNLKNYFRYLMLTVLGRGFGDRIN